MHHESRRSRPPRSRLALGLLIGALLAAGIACAPAEDASSDVAEATATLGPRAIAPSGLPYSEDRAPCADRDPLRQAFWGELHVHSALSMDAWLWDVRNGPDDVFRFAKGETTWFPPLDENGRPTRAATLERPLDFLSLTDHASFQGEVALCTRPGSPRYDTPECRLYRGETEIPDSFAGDVGARMGALSDAIDLAIAIPTRSEALCGSEDYATCLASMKTVWEEQQAAAERHYDRSPACRLTTLHGYEYTATPRLAKVHHNVIFRNAEVPKTPIAWIDEPDVYGLWAGLKAQCLDADGECDVITLPHNSNLSNGNMFAMTGQDLPMEEQRARAVLRGDIERLAEISQIKGDSECRNGFSTVLGGRDEFCEFEEWRGPHVKECAPDEVSFGALADQGCVSRSDYLRYALLEGFREEARVGVNPLKMGFVAATDAHNANPGDVEEYSYQGWSGSNDGSREIRLKGGQSPIPATTPLAANPGGIAGVWAEENSRDAIFDAMKRRETFGTSGPRMTARFFGGWGYDVGLCGDPDLVSKSYAGGVPMGGDLPSRPPGARAPTFVVSAMRDVGTPEHPGGLLQRAQIVKGWIDDDGQFHQDIYDIAGGDNDASVDLNTCEPRGAGHGSLCEVWTDPEFDPSRNAVYYVRVLENPSCRWSRIQCLEQPAAARSASCDASPYADTIQERLWTSPIWYDVPRSS